jgi:hypothetical protein
MSADSQAAPAAGAIAPGSAKLEGTRQFTLRLRVGEYSRLKHYSAVHDVKAQQVITDAIREYLDRRQGRPRT